ncbi:MAG: nucleotide sugar dehydrogenase [Oscillospiraceae bacterium]|nr:nucleotide sugar dehydrogenase [Oscillospiraceae bacterium]
MKANCDFGTLYEQLCSGETCLSVIGLGYVGMPLAVEFAKHVRVIGFNHHEARIRQYKCGIDPTMEVGDEAIRSTTVDFTSDETRLREARFHIIAVPTPINTDHTPDLFPVQNASRIVGRNLTPGSVVVYESTVYPGVTEDICVPILEAESGLTCGVDFKIGYSPERINPGDKVHTLTKIRKIVSGMDEETCRIIRQVYDIIIEAGTFPVSSIKTAEAVKVVENSQRDINIAFMNELAMVFDRMNIDTNEVIDGMNTKWNALGFKPGLVGGHCIGVDPYYFTYEAEKLGYHSQIILNGRIVNDGMAAFVAQKTVEKMVQAGLAPKKSRVVMLGLTFKENCPDVRNSRVADIINGLGKYGIETVVADPWADPDAAKKVYGLTLTPMDEICDADCVVAAVAHREFCELGVKGLQRLYGGNAVKILIDIKGMFDINELKKSDINWWRL